MDTARYLAHHVNSQRTFEINKHCLYFTPPHTKQTWRCHWLHLKMYDLPEEMHFFIIIQLIKLPFKVLHQQPKLHRSWTARGCGKMSRCFLHACRHPQWKASMPSSTSMHPRCMPSPMRVCCAGKDSCHVHTCIPIEMFFQKCKRGLRFKSLSSQSFLGKVFKELSKK